MKETTIISLGKGQQPWGGISGASQSKTSITQVAGVCRGKGQPGPELSMKETYKVVLGGGNKTLTRPDDIIILLTANIY